MNKQEIIEKIEQYFGDNEDVFNACVEELDAYNGYLGDDRYFSMDELNDLYSNQEPLEILYRAFYGYDEDSYQTDAHGEKEYGAFNQNRDFFRFNGYGNLVSTDYKDYSDRLDNHTVENMSKYRRYIDSIDDDEELAALFDELELDEEEEGEA